MSDGQFRIDSENVVHELVDGELIAIDLSSGSYYSLSGSGPEIWGLLDSGAGEAELSSALRDRYEAEPGRIEAEVSRFLSLLRENGLVVPAGEGGSPVEASDAGAPRQPFPVPVFERYTDMKDYFLLDPIHEVSSAGWPEPAP